MSELLDKGKTPEAWSESLREHGVHVSPRLIRSKARQTGHFHKFGRLMLLTPVQLEALIKSPDVSSSTLDIMDGTDG